ncbi:MAG: OmpH family outer membrane protein [Bacillota bacterium]|nr:OmpH family outer membrane protein [Bacillota bacterium]
MACTWKQERARSSGEVLATQGWHCYNGHVPTGRFSPGALREEDATIAERLKGWIEMLKSSTTKVLGLMVIAVAAVAVIVSLNGSSVSRAAGESPVVGFIYSPRIIAAVEGSQEYAKARKTYEDFAAKLQKDYESQAEGMDDQTKRNKLAELSQKLAAKQVDLNKPFQDKIQKAIEEVAKSEGVSIVLSQRVEFEAFVPVRDKNEKIVDSQPAPVSLPIVVTGGKDLTDIVIKKLGVK